MATNQNLTRERKIRNQQRQATARTIKEPAIIGEEVPMRVVACAGDPGLTEPWFFDILSKFVICMKEPVSRVPTNDKKWKLFYLVKRPRHLWIDASGNPDTNEPSDHSGTRRKDYFGNINIGNPSAYAIDTIPQLDTDYTIGQELICRKVPREYAGQDNIFESIFSNDDFDNYMRDENTPRVPTTTMGKRKGVKSDPYSTWYVQHVMEWSPKYWSSHGLGITTAAAYGGADWHKLKPIMAARKHYGAPVKPPRSSDPEKVIDGGDHFGSAKNDPAKNNQGDIIGIPASRFVGIITNNTFYMVLHRYLIDQMLKEVHPSYDSTIEALAQGKHRYQKASGAWFCDKAGYYTQEDCEGANPPGKWESNSKTKNPKTGVLQDNYPLFKISTRTHRHVDGSGAAKIDQIKEGDNEYISVNMAFGYVEWEDTNAGNKQRLSRDECMPLVIASPNNFPTPKERKIGALIYAPAYATVVAAQTPTTPAP